MTEDQKKKISLANKGRHLSPSTQFKKGHKINVGHVYWGDKSNWFKKNNKIRNTGRTKFKKGRILSKKIEEKRINNIPKGKNHYNWKGGISTVEDQIRKSKDYKEWRLAVYRKDYFMCQECGYSGKQINAHHIYSFSKYPEYRFDIGNGHTLCKSCHRHIEAIT